MRVSSYKEAYNGLNDDTIMTPAKTKAVVSKAIAGGSTYTDEMAQDAVGNILADSSEIDFTYSDATPSISASIVAGSIDETKLDTSVNASLDLADSALQAASITDNLNGTTSTKSLSENQGRLINNKSNFISLTAVTNGDYSANTGLTLTTGMIIYGIIPAATTNTQNARISIDNGSNYKNVKLLRGDNFLLSSYIENNYVMLRYDGTYWVWINTDLVAVSISAGSSAILTCASLSSAADGAYRVIAKGAFTSAEIFGFRVNGVSTAGAYYANTAQTAGTLTANGNTTAGGSYNESTLFFFGSCGASKPFMLSGDAVVYASQVQMTGTVSCVGESFQNTRVFGGWLNSTITDITSISLRNTSGTANMASGTILEIYKYR